MQSEDHLLGLAEPACILVLAPMQSLSQLSSTALAYPPAQPAIEFNGRWFSWGELRQVADKLSELLEVSGAGSDEPVAFIPRNRPSAIAALLALIADGRTIRMIYAFQSAKAIARDLERIDTSALIADAEDYSEPVLAALQARGIAGIALSEMNAKAIPDLAKPRATLNPKSSALAQLEILTSGTTGPPNVAADRMLTSSAD